jgi:hypothetical protein
MFDTLVDSEQAMDEIWDLAMSFRRQESEVEQAFSMFAWRSRAEVEGMRPSNLTYSMRRLLKIGI